VVELVIGEVIALLRRLTDKNALMHNGVWDKSAEGAHELRGRTIGIVGYGNIGTQRSVLAENLGMRVLFYDIADRLALGNATRCLTLDELLAASDIVSLHVDGRRQNANLFGEAEFATMRPGSLFLNPSRGFVVDCAALRAQLATGHIGGAAVDVFPHEPKGRGDEFISQLRGLPNVILTPHIAGSTEEAQEDIAQYVAGKFLDFVRDGSTSMSVNVPSLALPRSADTLRLIHLHRNVPGVLARVNGLLAEGGVNVEAQLLATHGEFGYVVTDSISGMTQQIVAAIRAMPETISLRVILD
jgi:D-3-phosphoglycerate dehydrogenase